MQQVDQRYFSWNYGLCAPADRPVRVIGGSLHSGTAGVRRFLCSELLHNGWGEKGPVTLPAGNPAAMPDGLSMTWFSLAENTFFSGTFPLPSERLRQLFAGGFHHPLSPERSTWTTVLVGCAPGGRLSVWLSGQGLTVEVAHFAAAETDLDWDIPPSRAEWARTRLARTVGEREAQQLFTEGAGGERWDNYRRRFAWSALVLGMGTDATATLVVRSFNGEAELFEFRGGGGAATHAETVSPLAHGVPKSMELHFTCSAGVRRVAKVQCDELETFAAFAKLSERTGASAGLSLHLDVTAAPAELRLYLCDDLYSLELLSAKVRISRSS